MITSICAYRNTYLCDAQTKPLDRSTNEATHSPTSTTMHVCIHVVFRGYVLHWLLGLVA